MSFSSYNFKDNLTIDNNKFLKWLDVTKTSRSNILCLDENNDIRLNSAFGQMYINCNNSGSNTLLNTRNSSGVIVGSKLGIGFSNGNLIGSTLTLQTNSFISTPSSDGYLGLSGSSTTTGSKIMIYGESSTQGNASGINMFAGMSTGSINLYTNNQSLKFSLTNSGVAQFTPDGNNVRCLISDSTTTLTNTVVITNTTNSTSASTGALQVLGGIGVDGNCVVNGTLSINSVIGNINFNSSQASNSYTTGAIFISGGLGISNTTPASSITAGGGLSIAGGAAISKNMFVGGTVTIVDTTPSTNSQTGCMVLYGGLGVNQTVWIRSSNVPQVKIAPTFNGDQTSIMFSSTSTFATNTTGPSTAWTIGQNVGNVGSGNFGISNYQSGTLLSMSANGYVGIGTSTPAAPFHIQLDTNTLAFSSQSNSPTLTSSDKLYIQSTATILQTSLLNITNNSTESFVSITSTTSPSYLNVSNIGIATTNPYATLDVNGTVFIRNTADSQSTSSSLFLFGGMHVSKGLVVDGPLLRLPKGTSTERPLIPPTGAIRYNTETQQFEGYGSGNAWGSLGGVIDVAQTTKILAELYAGSADGNLRFITKNAERMRINSAGNIGIGTTNPTSALHINTNNSATIALGGDDLWYIIKTTSGSLQFATDPLTPFLTMNSSGNVGINTTNTSTFRLNVTGNSKLDGDLYVNGYIVTTSGNTFNNIILSSTTTADNASTGTIVSYGGITINNTSPAVNSSNGGSLLTNGGASISKNLIVGGGITTSNLFSSNISSQSIYSTNVSCNSMVSTSVSSNSLVTSNLTCPNAQITGTLNSTYLLATHSTITNTLVTNMLSTNISSNNLAVVNSSISNLSATNLYNGMIASNSISTGTMLISSTAQANGINSGGSLTVLGGASITKDLYVGGTITSSSDIRLKDNVTPFDHKNILDIIESINSVKYTFKHDPHRTQHVGFIAQDFLQHFPELVKCNQFYSLDYSKVTVILLNCIKELKRKIIDLEHQIKGSS